MRHVFFAGPGHLDRHALMCHGQLHGLAHEVVLQSAAEAAAHDLHMHVDVVFGQAGEGGQRGHREARDLCARPDVESPVLEQHHGVHRLQRRMGEVGHAVLGLQNALGIGGLQHGFDIAVILGAAVLALGGEGFARLLEHGLRGGRVGRWPPFDLQQVGGLEGAPGVVGDHAHAAGDGDDLQHALGGFGLLGIEALDAAVPARVGAHCGEHHARHAQVDAVRCRAGGLGHDVQALHGLAEQPPLAGRLQRHFGGRFQLACDGSQGGVGDALAVRREHVAFGGLELRHGDARLLRRGGQQHLARDGAGHAQLVEGIGHGG